MQQVSKLTPLMFVIGQMPHLKAQLLLAVLSGLLWGASGPATADQEKEYSTQGPRGYGIFRGQYQRRDARLSVPLIEEGVAGTISTDINGVRCNLQAHAEAGFPNTVGKNEYVAKFNCNKPGNTFVRRGDRLLTTINGKECGLQIDADAGTPDTLFVNEHVAKFDCGPRADSMIFEKNKIYTYFDGEKCGLQWDSDAGTPAQLDKNEHLAKFDCKNRGRYLTFTEDGDGQVNEDSWYRSARVVSTELSSSQSPKKPE